MFMKMYRRLKFWSLVFCSSLGQKSDVIAFFWVFFLLLFWYGLVGRCCGWTVSWSPRLEGKFPDEWCRTTPPLITHWLPHSCCLFGSGFSRDPTFCLWDCPHYGDGTRHLTHTHTHTRSLSLFPSHMHSEKAWLCDRCSKSRLPDPASFVCPQLFRPGACIVLAGSLPAALWPEPCLLMGPEREWDRGGERGYFCCCGRIMFCFLNSLGSETVNV